MASKPNLPENGRAFTPGLGDVPQKPRIEPDRHLIGRRKSIRVDTRIPAAVITATGASMADTGLQLEGNRQMADCLQTGHLQFIRCRPASIQLCFSLPGNPGPCDTVKTQRQTLNARKTKHNAYRTGIRFPAFNEGRETLAEYLLFREPAQLTL